jgi:hypothetical protein
VSEPLLSAPLLGSRVLELSREGESAWRLSVTRVDGPDRRQVGGFDLAPGELPLFLVSVQAMVAYTRQGSPTVGSIGMAA